jgi:hypothetical protein
MDLDEQAVIEYLKTQPGVFLTVREISRRAARDRELWQQSPTWARPILIRLANKDRLETNAMGQYRLKPEEEKKKKKTEEARPKKTAPVAPHMQKILEASGKVFDLDEFFRDKPSGKKK